MELKTRLDKLKIEKLTDRLLTERQNNLKQVLEIDHRLESVGLEDGVEFINDSKATDISATKYSLQCMNAPLIWILSGDMRYEQLSSLKRLAGKKVKAMIYVGKEDSDLVEEFLDEVSMVVQSDSLEDAINEAKTLGLEGDVVLYSPASPTGTDFENYKERGNEFRRLLS